MMSIFVCEEEDQLEQHKVEKIDDEDDCYGSSEDMTESQLKSWVKLCQSHDYLRFIFYEQDVILSCLHSWETPRCSSSQKTEKTLLLQGTLNIIMLYPQFISKVKDMQSPTRHSCSF